MTRFNLPVFSASQKPASPEELFGRALHAEEIYEGALGETVMPEWGGVALVAREFPGLAAANQVRHVPPDAAVVETIAAVSAFYADRKLTCRQWTFTGGKVPEGFKRELAAAGFALKECDLWVMKSPANLAVRPGLTVIPGRASFAKLAELAEAAERASGTTSEANLAGHRESSARHLDDPRVDNLLVLDGETPVGTAYLVTAGEAGLIEDLYVHPAYVRRGVATTLLDRLVELAARSRMRQLMLFCDTDNPPAKALYQKTGFVPIARGEIMTMGDADAG